MNQYQYQRTAKIIDIIVASLPEKVLRQLGIDKDFCQANAIKYLARYGKKAGKNRKDLLKAIHYIVLLMSSEDKKGGK